jgi:hypothetical protein
VPSRLAIDPMSGLEIHLPPDACQVLAEPLDGDSDE